MCEAKEVPLISLSLEEPANVRESPGEGEADGNGEEGLAGALSDPGKGEYCPSAGSRTILRLA